MEQVSEFFDDDRKLFGAVALGVLGLVAILLVLGMSGGDNSETPTQDLNDTDAPDTVDSGEDEVRQVVVEGGYYYFEPDSIQVNQGETVRITFNPVDGTHNLRIPELNEGTNTMNDLRNGSFEVTFNETGTYDFLCSVPGHADQGMTGTITVS